MSRALKESLRRIPETCPQVNEAFKSFIWSARREIDDDAALKWVEKEVEALHDLNITLRENLRGELITAIEEIHAAEEEIENLKAEIDRLNALIDDYKDSEIKLGLYDEIMLDDMKAKAE